jgi:hypothetical protein
MALIIGALGRRGETVRKAADIVVLVEIVSVWLARRPLIARLRLLLRLLSRRDDAEVVFRVLKVILRRDGIAAGVSIARQLEIFLRDVMRIAANLYVRAVGLVGTGERIGAPTIVIVVIIVVVAATHTLILPRSHRNSLPFLSVPSGISRASAAIIERIQVSSCSDSHDPHHSGPSQQKRPPRSRTS